MMEHHVGWEPEFETISSSDVAAREAKAFVSVKIS